MAGRLMKGGLAAPPLYVNHRIHVSGVRSASSQTQGGCHKTDCIITARCNLI